MPLRKQDVDHYHVISNGSTYLSNIFMLIFSNKSSGYSENKLKIRLSQPNDVPLDPHWVQDRFRVTKGVKPGIYFCTL